MTAITSSAAIHGRTSEFKMAPSPVKFAAVYILPWGPLDREEARMGSTQRGKKTSKTSKIFCFTWTSDCFARAEVFHSRLCGQTLVWYLPSPQIWHILHGGHFSTVCFGFRQHWHILLLLSRHPSFSIKCVVCWISHEMVVKWPTQVARAWQWKRCLYVLPLLHDWGECLVSFF